MDRRFFLQKTSLAAAGLAATGVSTLSGSARDTSAGPKAFKYRIAFGAWINDMRTEPLPLEDWPAPQLDDITLKSVIQAMELQSRFGYNMLDVWGYFATKAWPLNIGDGIDQNRRKKVRTIIREAHRLGIKPIYGMGTYSWGYEEIIRNNPSLTAINQDGKPNPAAMCDANPESFEWVKKILDFVLSEFDFDGLHLESNDQGGCFCPQCAGAPGGIVGYHSRINTKTADYIRSKWPKKIINVIPIGWAAANKERFTEQDKDHIIEMSKHIDGFYDQGWHGTYIAPEQRADFIKRLHCAYGTSGGRWMYPGQRWDRESFFVPYTRQQGVALKQQYEQGARGCMYYQGPVNNPSTEVNIAFGGRILADASRSVEAVLTEVLERLYQPKSEAALKTLVQVFQRGESAYFDQWVDVEERFAKAWNTRPPGEFYMDSLFGDSPGPAGYLLHAHYLDAKGRLAYKKELMSIYRDLEKVDGQFNDHGRMPKLKRCIVVTLTTLNTIMAAKGEPMK